MHHFELVTSERGNRSAPSSSRVPTGRPGRPSIGGTATTSASSTGSTRSVPPSSSQARDATPGTSQPPRTPPGAAFPCTVTQRARNRAASRYAPYPDSLHGKRTAVVGREPRNGADGSREEQRRTPDRAGYRRGRARWRTSTVSMRSAGEPLGSARRIARLARLAAAGGSAPPAECRLACSEPHGDRQ